MRTAIPSNEWLLEKRSFDADNGFVLQKDSKYISSVFAKFFFNINLFIYFLLFFCCSDQNPHWKLGQQAPSFGSILAYLETTT